MIYHSTHIIFTCIHAWLLVNYSLAGPFISFLPYVLYFLFTKIPVYTHHTSSVKSESISYHARADWISIEMVEGDFPSFTSGDTKDMQLLRDRDDAGLGPKSRQAALTPQLTLSPPSLGHNSS